MRHIAAVAGLGLAYCHGHTVWHARFNVLPTYTKSLVQNRDCRRWRWQLQSHSRWWHHKRRNRFCGGGRGRGLVDPRRGLPDPGKPFLSPRPSSISSSIRCLGEMCIGGGVWALGGLVASGLDGALSCGGPFQFAPFTFESVTRCGSIGHIRAKP